MDLIQVIEGDITQLHVDAVVSAASEHLLGGSGVDSQIHRAAGPDLRTACEQIEQWRPGVRCPIGEARITEGFNLSASWIIHTVGPEWHGGGYGEANVLANCYRNCLELAAENKIRSIAFPAISCGALGYPAERAAAVAIREIGCFSLLDDLFDEILLVAHEKFAWRALQRVAGAVRA